MATIDGRTVHVATHSCEDTYETAVNDGDRISKIRARHATRNRNRKTMVSMPICGAEVALCGFCSLSFTFAVEGPTP